MCVQYMTAIWDLQGLSSTQKYILLKLGDNADEDGVCWPSIGYLCEKTGTSERTVQNAIKALVRLGFVSCEYRKRRSTIFTLHIPGVKFAQKAAENGAEKRPKATPQQVRPNPAPNAPRTVRETFTPISPINGGKIKHSREEENNPRAMGINPRALRALVDPEEKRQAIRVRRYYETGFWLEHWGQEPKPRAGKGDITQTASIQ